MKKMGKFQGLLKLYFKHKRLEAWSDFTIKTSLEKNSSRFFVLSFFLIFEVPLFIPNFLEYEVWVGGSMRTYTKTLYVGQADCLFGQLLTNHRTSPLRNFHSRVWNVEVDLKVPEVMKFEGHLHLGGYIKM